MQHPAARDKGASSSSRKDGLPSLKVQVSIGTAIAVLVLWVVPAINAYIKRHLEPETIQMFALSVRCRLPGENEAVTVLVRDAGSVRQRSECVYVRSRGAYGVAK